MNSPRGSQWRKWDLHFHTPSSGEDYKHGGATNEEVVSTLVGNGMACVAVTDHNIIDAQRLNGLRTAANGDLVLFPGIEFRTELGGSQSVHIIGLFPEDSDLRHVWDTLNIRLKIEERCGRYENGRFQRDSQRFYVDLKEAADTIHDLGGVVTVHAGRKSNSLEEINNEVHKQALKTDLLRDSVDILEIGRVQDIADYRGTVFPAIGFCRPMIICSDNHDIRDYQLRAFCWVKADCSFCGLRQTLLEPDERVFIGDTPSKIRIINEKPTVFLESVRIKQNPGSILADKWFDAELPLNPDLVAIVGRKGSGKSALADIIALCCNTRQEKEFAFLKKDRFRAGRDCPAKHFTATLEWHSQYTVTKCLNDTVDVSVHESVRYIPQNFLENVCNALAGADKTPFDRELEKVVFSHVSRTERLGCESLQDLQDKYIGEISKAIAAIRIQLHELNRTIESYEYQLTTDYKKSLQEKLKLLKDRLQHHEKNKPAAVSKPAEAPDPKCAERQKELTRLIGQRNAAVEVIAEQEKLKKEFLLRKNSAEQLSQRLERLRNFFESIRDGSKEDAKNLGLSFDDIVKLDIRSEMLLEKKREINAQLDSVTSALDPCIDGGPASKKTSLDLAIQEVTAELEAPEQQYHRYLESLAAWEGQRRVIEGNEDDSDSIQGVSTHLAALDQVPSLLNSLYTERWQRFEQIHGQIQKQAEKYRELYKPVQSLVETREIIQEQKKLEFNVSIVDDGFHSTLESLIALSRSDFKSCESFETFVSTALSSCDFNDSDDIRRLIELVLEKVDPTRNLSIKDGQRTARFMTQRRSLADLYNFLFGMAYLDTRYRLKYDGKELDQLSPGEKGTLLLMFYLLVDNSDYPIVIDQPEENLDNETVYGVLVPCVKETKKSRQVILVTHNPNLAVVCDAEQVIHAEITKENGIEIKYTSGAIENSVINAHLINVLEGTRPAFDKRDQKYSSVARKPRNAL
jgi:ABC-type lipoprotein export system ATPase subunit